MKVGLTMDENIWKEFKEVAKKFGVTASYMCQIILASVIEAQKKGVDEITKNMMIGMVKGARDISKKEKERVLKELCRPD
jgi:antitoxin component of RelBE/YafQ-DinJ toxin-antitoxin module